MIYGHWERKEDIKDTIQLPVHNSNRLQEDNLLFQNINRKLK